MQRSLALLALCGLSTAALAQAPAPAASPNLIINGDFKKFTPTDNLWDGVDGGGYLAGFRRQTYAVTESGKIGGLDMPISVSYQDINGDGLPDLVTCDPAGVVRAYINSGTKTEPKFTYAEVVPIFPPQIAKDVAYDRNLWTSPHSIPKLSLYDWNHNGSLDMVIGNYCGDIILVRNTGGPNNPAFAQPANYMKVKVPLAGKRPWGNLFAPCPIDWNKDGKTDLLIGEGSYSANAVYVLINQSSSNEPKFSDDQRYYLCYGDGREQLVPTVADYNGDGLPDVLVGDRLGTVGVYLNPGNWKPGTELPLSKLIKFGNTEKLGMGVSPYAADFNGDGLFDLIIGKTDGHIGVAINKGTKTEPKFDAVVNLKGEKLFKDKTNLPANWTYDVGNDRGNLYAYCSVIDEASPNGGKVLRCSYYPSPNKVIKMNQLSVDGHDSTDFFRYWRDEWVPTDVKWAGYNRASDSFLVRQLITAVLKPGTTYQLRFKVRGKNINDGVCTLAYLGAAENVATKFKKNDRGGVKVDKDDTHEEVNVTEAFTSGSQWKQVEKTFVCGFKERGLKALDATTLAMLEFKFTLPQYNADWDICDVELVAKPGGNK